MKTLAAKVFRGVGAVTSVSMTLLFAPAILLHEITHYGAARLLGFDVLVQTWIPPEMQYRVDDDRERAAAAVAVAPTIVGFMLGGSALIAVATVYTVPSATAATVYAAASIIMYSAPSPADLRAARVLDPGGGGHVPD